jgi:hypothetical protein
MISFLLRRAHLLIAFVLTLLVASSAGAQQVEQEFQLRLGADIEKKLVKDLRVVVTPEVRTMGINPDRYLLEVGLKYDPLKFLSLRPGFRGDLEEKSSGLEGSYRAKFDVVGKVEFGDFEPNARLRYTYEFGPYRVAQHSLRYLLGLDYEIGKSDVTLGASGEAFQDLGLGSFYKMRYGIGAEWDFYKTKKVDQSISLDYNFDYYLDRYLNVHIVEIGYKIVF